MPDHEKINQAIRDCLLRCSQSERPLDALTEELGSLNARPDWSRSEVKIVTKTVLRMLNMLLEQPDEDPPAA